MRHFLSRVRGDAPPKQRIVAACVALIVVVIGAWRFFAWRNLDPGLDQAYFAWRIREMRAATHFLVHVTHGQSLRDALQSDQASWIHQVARTLYDKPPMVFALLSLIVHYLSSFLFGSNYSGDIAFSVLASVLTLPTIAWLAWRTGVPPLVAVLVSCFVWYLHWWSAWGVHNVGVLAFAGVAAMHAELVSRPRPWPVVAGVSGIAGGLACYVHWTDVLLVGPFIVLVLGANSNWPLHQRASALLLSLGTLALCLAPGLVLSWALTRSSGNDYSSSSGSVGLPGLFSRMFSWVSTLVVTFTLPGLLLAAAGALVLIARRTVAARVPVAAVMAHLLVWLLVPGFSWNGSATAYRTIPYVLPFLALLAAATATRDFGWMYAAASAITAVAFLAVQSPLLFAADRVSQRFPGFYGMYFARQGLARRWVSDIQRLVPDGATLMTFDYPEQYFLASLGSFPPRVTLSPLKQLTERVNSGTFAEYRERLGLRFQSSPDLFMLAGGGDALCTACEWSGPATPEDLRASLARLLGPDGFRTSDDPSTCVLIASWEGIGGGLYRCKIDHRGSGR